MRPYVPSLLAALLLAAPSFAAPAARTARTETAIFAGGCFWCMETQFEGLPGVKSVISGYTGGFKAHPTYVEVCAHTTGHLESIQVTYDPAVISYAQLLDRYWHGIDPTQDDGQFCDKGDTYRSAIFVNGPEQKREAIASKVALERSHVLPGPVVTTIRDASTFWPAEEYHQDFWRKDPVRYRSYRLACGRDRRLRELWGDKAVKPLVH